MAKEIPEYNLKVGMKKSLKNALVVLLPALIAAWGSFQVNLPETYKPIAMFIGGFVGYAVKNWIENH